MGMMPGGMGGGEMEGVWGKGWEELCDGLVRCSLLVKSKIGGENFWSLYPFMAKYAEERMNG